MSDTIKQAGIKQADGTYLMKDIGVDYSNVDGLDTAATAFKAKSADKATADKNNKDITEYIASGSKSNENLVLTKGDGTSSSVDLSMRGATPTTNGESGFVPQPTSADNNKFLKGDGTWSTPENRTYQGSDNIEIDSSDNSIDLTDSTVVSGTYGPSADVIGTMGTTITIPKFTVDDKGRLTSAGQQTYTSVDTQYSAGDGLSQDGTTFSLASHSSSTPGYGPGTEYNYGHVILSSTYKALAVGSGIAASQGGLFDAYNELNNRIKGNDYRDITAEFDDGTFSNHLSDYNPGNYIVKRNGSGHTYVAVLADYNTFYSPWASTATMSAAVTQNHWVAIVFGFGMRMMHSKASTDGGFMDTEMNTWLKGDCTTAVQALFDGSSHLISHTCYLSTGTYNGQSATHGFSDKPESDHYTMLMTEAQLGIRAWSDLGGWNTGEACRPLKIFQNESFMSVLTRNFGQPAPFNMYGPYAWLRDISSSNPAIEYCSLNLALGVPRSASPDSPLGCYPIIMLK